MTAKEPKGTEDLLGQFRELGQQLEKAIRRAWESDEGQEVREQINKGIKELNARLGKVAEEARKSQAVQDLQKQAKGAVEAARRDETVQNLSKEIGQALQSLNDQLNKLIKSVPGGKPQK